MYVQEISIEICSKIDRNEALEAFGLLLEFYRDWGQIQWNIQSDYCAEKVLHSLPYTLEKNSLDKVFNGFYVEMQIKKLEELCQSKLRIATVGTSGSDGGTICACAHIERYILATQHTAITSPVFCGTCNKAVPLYRLPPYDDHWYVPILSWQSNYQSCDTLQMNCEVGEAWALDQMQELNSELTKQGRWICAVIESMTSTPTYYFLYNDRAITIQEDKHRHCPGCGGNWLLDVPVHGMDFRCDKCMLVSSLTKNSDAE